MLDFKHIFYVLNINCLYTPIWILIPLNQH